MGKQLRRNGGGAKVGDWLEHSCKQAARERKEIELYSLTFNRSLCLDTIAAITGEHEHDEYEFEFE